MKKGEDFIGITVSFLCHDGRGNVLLSKRGKNARDEHGRWDCGGGGVEFGDTVETTLGKEIQEEYCTSVLSAEFLGFRDVFREKDGRKTHWVSLDYLVLVDAKKWGNGEPHKLEEVRWFPFTHLPDPMHSQWPMFLEQYASKLIQLENGTGA
ncbi:MAG: NUDIX domain-containing protein [Minisyncoccota bacterium]